MGAGLYIHVPFCRKKCPYCDFYSVKFSEKSADDYTNAVKAEINSYRGKNILIDTVYFGGGTPNLISADRIHEILSTVRGAFILEDGAEITLEANPESLCDEDLCLYSKAGINRLSLGLESANEGELSFLGRAHNTRQVEACVKKARAAGIDNISLDLMLALKGQTKENIAASIDFCDKLKVDHISAYMLKIEPKTLFYAKRETLEIPDEDFCAELYEYTCGELERRGYEQYEISNFAKGKKYSRHNIKYWQCEPYIGIGPAAHGFWDGRRYFHERSLEKYIKNPIEVVFDALGGDLEEKIMLGLRLSRGIDLEELKKDFSFDDAAFLKKAEAFERTGFLKIDGSNISFTTKGFLVSNSILCELLLSIKEN